MRQTLIARGDQPAIPAKLKPLGVSKIDNCEKLTTPLENYKMYHQEDDTNSDMTSDDDMSRCGRETPPPRSSHSLSSDRDQERRGRSSDVEPRDRWPYIRNPRSRLPQRDLSLPVMSRPHFGLDRDDDRRSLDYESRSQDAESYQNVVELKEDKKPQNPIQDNLENYRKLLSLGVQLAEDDRHSHMTQGHSSRSKRSAYPSTSRGLKPMPEAKKPAHRRGICEDESSHGVIMEKFIKDVSRSSKSGRARELNERPPPRFPRPSDNWKDAPSNRRESVIQERGPEGSAFRGGFRFNADLLSRNRALERKRRYHFDSDEKGPGHDPNNKSCVRKKPFECGSEMRQAMSMGNLSCPPVPESPPVDFPSDPYVCDECGRSFGVISEFVEHQIMHTRENLYEYGESFIHSVAVNGAQRGPGGGKRFECKECGETFSRSAALAEHRQIHAREYLAECHDQGGEDAVMPSPTFSELQKMYGKDKFYECKVCKETFLHSSALIEHQKTHGRGNSEDREGERERQRMRARAREQQQQQQQREREQQPRDPGEPFLTCPNFSEFRKMYRRDKIYECKVCGESFLHLSSLREHQKIHTRGNPFDSNKRVCEETFVPGQSLKRRQKTYREKLFDFNNARDALLEGSDPGDHQKSRSRKSFFEGRGYEKPFAESQKSHTITRPPGDEEDDKPFTISVNPNPNPATAATTTTAENSSPPGKPYERSVIHSLGPASSEAPKSRSAFGFTKPKPVAESSTQTSSGGILPRILSGVGIFEGKEYKRSVIHSLPAPRPLKRHRLNDQLGCDEEGGESSIYISDLTTKRRKIPTRDNGSSHTDSVPPGAPRAEPPSLSGEPREPNQDVTFSVPSSSVREHQKARAKKKYIEPRSNETSVIHSLPFGDLLALRRRAKPFECQECGEAFARRSDLIEHQKIHDRERPSGSRHYERSVIRSLSPSDPQTSYAQERFIQEQVRKFREFGQRSATSNSLSVQKIHAQEKYAEEPHDKDTHGQKVHDKEPNGQEPHGQEPHGDEPQDKEPQDQEMRSEEPHGDKPNGQEPHGDEPHDNGPQDQEMRSEEPHGEESHGQSTAEDTTTMQASGSDEHHQKEDASDTIYECQDCGLGFSDLTDLTSHQDVHGSKSLVDSREYAHSEAHVHSVSEFENRCSSGEKLYECPKCGESFIHSSLLFEHQRVHEQEDPLHAVKACDDGFIALLPVVRPRRNRAAAATATAATSTERNPAAAAAAAAVTGSAIRCRQCGQGFIHSTALNEHMRQHRDEEMVEQSELAQEIFIQGLALAEYQGSETEEEEKLFECALCGECFFTAKQLGDHHTKVHKDEPYEYGPSYTHASFLAAAEPLRKHIPLYECKDCGQPFLDDAVLAAAAAAERMVFHRPAQQREGGGSDLVAAATAQEVEANALVPQEVLRIQGSNAEAAEPEVEAAEPEVEAAEPEVEAAEPNGEAEGPDGEAAEPDGEAEQPNGEAEQPNGDADEPDGADIEDPEERADEPEEDVEEPEGDADEPDGGGADIEDPEEEGEDQEIEVEEPYYNCHECTETFASSAAFGEHLKSHASVIIFEPANAPGESGYIERASTSASASASAGGAEQADGDDDKYFKCDVCGQLFHDRLSLARHQNSHTG